MKRYTTQSGSVYEVTGSPETGLLVRRLSLGKKHEERGTVAKRNADQLGSGEWVPVEMVTVALDALYIQFPDGKKLRTNMITKTEEV